MFVNCEEIFINIDMVHYYSNCVRQEDQGMDLGRFFQISDLN